MTITFNIFHILAAVGGVVFGVLVTVLGAFLTSHDKFLVGILAAITAGAVTTALAAMGVEDFALGVTMATIVLIGNDLGVNLK